MKTPYLGIDLAEIFGLFAKLSKHVEYIEHLSGAAHGSGDFRPKISLAYRLSEKRAESIMKESKVTCKESPFKPTAVGFRCEGNLRIASRQKILRTQEI